MSFAICGDFGDFPTLKNLFGSLRKTILNRSRVSEEHLVNAIEDFIYNLTCAIANDQEMKFEYMSTDTWDNFEFDPSVGIVPSRMDYGKNLSDFKTVQVTSANEASLQTIDSFLHTMKCIYELLVNNSFATKRDLFYRNPSVYNGEQRNLDRNVDIMCSMFHTDRLDLHVLSSSKGIVFGDLKMCLTKDSTIQVDCLSCPQSIPLKLDQISDVISSAKFILVIEKDATFQNFVQNNLIKMLPNFIMFTAKGYPDIASKAFLRYLVVLLKIPVFILCDADPHGIDIMAQYKYGSRTTAPNNAHLTLPPVYWLGIWPSEIDSMHISDDCLLNMTDNDLNKIEELKRRPYMPHHPEWADELNILRSLRKKAEIQAIAASSSENVFTFGYLIKKLKALSHGTDPYVGLRSQSPTSSVCSTQEDEEVLIDQEFSPEVETGGSQIDKSVKEDGSDENDDDDLSQGSYLSYFRGSLDSRSDDFADGGCSQNSLTSSSDYF